jgi:glycosyltransferase involved in cell wall biosynthesis
MKILHINNFFTKYGGAENSFWKISNFLKNKGNKIYYFSTDKQPYFIANYEYSKYFPQYKDKRKSSIIKDIINIFYNFEAKHNLENYLKKIQPDLIITHNILFHLTSSIFDACKKFNIPIVMYIQDPRLFCPGGLLAYSDKYCYEEPCITGNPISCIKNRCKLSSLKASIITSLNFIFVRNQKLFNKCDAIICLSEALKNLAVRAGAPAEKIKVINHFIEDEKLLIKPVYKNENYFLYVGRLDREKGVHFLIEAMKNVSSAIQLHVVGDGCEKENLISQKESLNLNNIKFLGHLNGQALEEEYKNCIATVLPCNWFEAFGLTNIESFLYGKPVIASNIAAIPEIIDDGVNGILVPPTDINALSAAIEKLYYNPDLVVQMGKNGRNKVEKLYTTEIYWDKFSKEILSKFYAPDCHSQRPTEALGA